MRELRDGNIAIPNISPLMDMDPEELKRAVDRLRESFRKLGGQVGRLSESKNYRSPETGEDRISRGKLIHRGAVTAPHILGLGGDFSAGMPYIR